MNKANPVGDFEIGRPMPSCVVEHEQDDARQARFGFAIVAAAPPPQIAERLRPFGIVTGEQLLNPSRADTCEIV